MLSILEYLDEFSSQIEIHEVQGKKLVVKKYKKETGILKWLLINASNLSINIYPFAFQPFKRLEREVCFYKDGSKSFKKPVLYLVDFLNLSMVREYVDGLPFPKINNEDEFLKLGAHLNQLHGEGWALGDSKISNFILSRDSIYLIDSEQAIRTDNIQHYVWDLIVLGSTIVFFGLEQIMNGGKDLKKIFKALAEGYASGGAIRLSEIIDALEKPSLKTITLILIPYPFNKAFLNSWKEAHIKYY
ncbi:MAG: serine/threonine protein kinase [Thermosphaera sp.]